jgi:hypothetical protein
VKAFLGYFFFFVATVVLAAGISILVSKGSPWLLLIGFAAYAGLFIKYGCQSH